MAAKVDKFHKYSRRINTKQNKTKQKDISQSNLSPSPVPVYLLVLLPPRYYSRKNIPKDIEKKDKRRSVFFPGLRGYRKD
jgi:hypothetical protein